MAATSSILGKQEDFGIEGEMLIFSGHEIQCAAQGYYESPYRIRMPIKCPSCICMLKRDTDRIDFATEKITSCTLLEINNAFLKMRLAIIPSPETNTLDHEASSKTVTQATC